MIWVFCANSIPVLEVWSAHDRNYFPFDKYFLINCRKLGSFTCLLVLELLCLSYHALAASQQSQRMDVACLFSTCSHLNPLFLA
ncbi:unnamed protein product [Musa banksii]